MCLACTLRQCGFTHVGRAVRDWIINARQESELCCKALCYHSLAISLAITTVTALYLVEPCFFARMSHAFVLLSGLGVVQAGTTQTVKQLSWPNSSIFTLLSHGFLFANFW